MRKWRFAAYKPCTTKSAIIDKKLFGKNKNQFLPGKRINPNVDLGRLHVEIAQISYYIRLAKSIAESKTETKVTKLLDALENGFSRMRELGANEKVIIFTESRRTQLFLKEYLERQPEYQGKIATFNGTNDDDLSRKIYEMWKEEYAGSSRITNNRDVDIRQALIDHFRDHAKIMIATESAAEGVNMQFCSLLVNYDLPWNPQRIEQRIGRCHRYGQKHDVVVTNFRNENNVVDQHIYDLLDAKFKLFSGVFGTSDEVLGSIEGGVDFEKSISDIFDKCRTQSEIENAFNDLRKKLSKPIADRVKQAYCGSC